MEAARRRAVRDLREIAEEAEAPRGSDGAALRRRLAELRQRVLAVARFDRTRYIRRALLVPVQARRAQVIP